MCSSKTEHSPDCGRDVGHFSMPGLKEQVWLVDGEIKFQPCEEMLGWEILPVQ